VLADYRSITEERVFLSGDIRPASLFEYALVDQPIEKVKVLRPFLSIYHHCFGIQDRCILSLAAFAGLRSGELFGLMWDDINFEKNTITLNRQWTHRRIKDKLKSKKSKAEFPMVKDLTYSLKEWRLLSKCKSWVFPALGEVNPLDADHWSKYTFKKLLEANNLPEVKLHSLRHFFASAIIHSGVSAEDTQELMRHSSYQITMGFYRHLFPGQLQEALDKFHNYISAVKKNV